MWYEPENDVAFDKIFVFKIIAYESDSCKSVAYRIPTVILGHKQTKFIIQNYHNQFANEFFHE